MKGKILVTARSFQKMEGPHQEILREAGYELVGSALDRPLEAMELEPLLEGAEAAILGLDAVSRLALEKAERLKVISRFGVGVDRIDLQAATDLGIVVTVTPGANSVAVAELTIGLIIALARQIPQHDRQVRAGGWDRAPGSELQGTTLGLVGLGRIGSEVGRRAAAFGMRILFTDPAPPSADLVGGLGAEPRDLNELLAESDVVSLHLPLGEATRGIIGARELGLMKRSARLVNTSRGGLVDEGALADALRGGQLAGAAADAFESEPPGDNPLLALGNFVATPHIGSVTVQTTLRMGRMAAENALAVLSGLRPEHVVNPEVYSRKQLRAARA